MSLWRDARYLSASDAAQALYGRAASFLADTGATTIATSQVALLVAPAAKAKRVLGELVRVGLMVEREGGYELAADIGQPPAMAAAPRLAMWPTRERGGRRRPHDHARVSATVARIAGRYRGEGSP